MPKEKELQPAQHQRRQPGREYKMKPRPQAEDVKHRGSGKLQGKVAIITGGDSGIGRAVAIAFAKEGADVSIVYLEERKDANETERLVKEHGGRCLLTKGDFGREEFCRKAVPKQQRSSASWIFSSTTLPNNIRRARSRKSLRSNSNKPFGQTSFRSSS